ncbi:MAG: 3-hydroxyacyl-CoA dehydrogenase [Oceanicaulis sp.]|uniref:3-hydroxyacyl-CoA dehydrogenase NAD-binding domain-containing protein n=1 Tax=unclassified Oceanicaulis TaxID=2632123 RepID=UPI000C5779FE|nr:MULTISPECIES: 3-hydroxyacyl-CoA dehydrogenase NAD-binding domain-containing protein [unclassified Oceanicaulis]MAB69272.1 3-hydroxyacyl-CoA dehydrogenase [Oceanicaulis sp.]MBC40209.1 3-hydroxyacyl-CoA dehydrogenase [Oceanicaulis sp.]MBG34370.1 3-hydroxyacyl-CoA dehydrogenase [Oceanicaulis sp.]HBU62817.1 3-hydroxyacyl-CoA dehydrogenase [Oceanicaulis sp.]
MTVKTQVTDGVLVIVSDNPPVNALSHALRSGLMDAVTAAGSDAAVKAVVIAADGRTFHAGADITEFGKPPQSPSLPEVIEAIEALDKPVVAALHGTTLGGGLEVALGAHYRVAARGSKLGLPEVKLGLLPGAGGTQRLPRVVGVEAALEMIAKGDPISAEKAESLGLVDELVEADKLRQAAIAFARARISDGPRRSGARTDKLSADADVFHDFAKANARRFRGMDAPQACIEAVKAATEKPLEEGLKIERALFAKLMAGDQSAALRHLFFAERAAAKIDDIAKDTPRKTVSSVGVIGAGTMGGGITMNFLSAGIPVTLVEREQAALDRGVATIRKNYEASAAKGRLSQDQVEKAMALLTPTLKMDALSDCDLIIEAVFELMRIKKEIFTALDSIAKKDAILATNTSYLDVNEIAAVTQRPESVLGLHFFSPANIMKLLEIVRGAKTADTVLATAMDLSRRIGKVAVVAGVCHGFIGNRMLAQRQAEANSLILEGAKPWDVDRVLVEFGLPMGPFQMADLAGLDIGWDPDATSSSTVREILCEQDRRGQKTGAGFYDYDQNRRGAPSEHVERLIAEFAEKAGYEQRAIDDQEIRERLLYPMVNEGAKILDEGIAQRASDIDVVWVYGYGWPTYRGGPMFWADQIGAKTVLDGLEKHADRLADGFEISPFLRRKAEENGRFN